MSQAPESELEVSRTTDRRRTRGLSEGERASELLGAIFMTSGIARLTAQRFYRIRRPYWLVESRREIDVFTGTVEVCTGVLLFIPKLRKLVRWANMAVPTTGSLAPIGEARHPS